MKLRLILSVLIFTVLLSVFLSKNSLWLSITKVFAGEQRYIDLVFDNVKITKDVKYGLYNGQSLLLDIYEPVGDTENLRPAIILVHGGGFTSGDKNSFAGSGNNGNASDLAKRGYVAFPINYTLVNGSGLGMDSGSSDAIRIAKNDTLAAVRYIRANALKYKIDPNKIIVGGFSAGAVTSLYTAYDTASVGNSGTPGVSSKVALAISFSGGMLPDDIDLIDSGEPPAILINSDNDDIVPITTAQTVYNRLKLSGIKTELHVYHVGHATPGVLDAQIKVRQFIFKTLNLSGALPPVIPTMAPTDNPNNNPDEDGNPESYPSPVPPATTGTSTFINNLTKFLPGLNEGEAKAAYSEGGAIGLYRYVKNTNQYTQEQIRNAVEWWISNRNR